MQPHEHLIVVAADLARSSPQRWADFLEAFAAFTDTYRTKLVHSPLPELPVAQGKAQSLAFTHELLKGAPATADKIKSKGKTS
jgi:hypothetical protein